VDSGSGTLFRVATKVERVTLSYEGGGPERLWKDGWVMMRFPTPLYSERECLLTKVRNERDIPPFVLEARKRMDVTSRYKEQLAHREGGFCGEVKHTTSYCEIPPSPTLAGSVELNNMEHCHLHSKTYTGEYFVFLMSHSISGRTDSSVGYTTNPLREVCLRNQRHFCEGDATWLLDIVLGPFSCMEIARDCGFSWVTGTRGKIPKREKAPYLSSAYCVAIYSYLKKSCRPLANILEKFADPRFLSLLEGEGEEVNKDSMEID